MMCVCSNVPARRESVNPSSDSCARGGSLSWRFFSTWDHRWGFISRHHPREQFTAVIHSTLHQPRGKWPVQGNGRFRDCSLCPLHSTPTTFCGIVTLQCNIVISTNPFQISDQFSYHLCFVFILMIFLCYSFVCLFTSYIRIAV
jgi:hypothetical protein